MQGNEIVWIASIILGLTVLGWLVLDWLESVHQWETPDIDPHVSLGRAEHPLPDALELESELMLGYPLDPFAPSLLWRPLPQEEWVAAQEEAESVTDDAVIVKTPPIPHPSQSA
jgi:hypothetical protein